MTNDHTDNEHDESQQASEDLAVEIPQVSEKDLALAKQMDEIIAKNPGAHHHPESLNEQNEANFVHPVKEGEEEHSQSGSDHETHEEGDESDKGDGGHA